MSARSVLSAVALALAIAPAAAFAQASPSAGTFAARYDLVRREVGTIAPDPDGTGPLAFAATRSTYDAAGRLVKVEKGQLSAWQSEAIAPKDWTGFTVLSQSDIQYDVMGRKVGESTSGGGQVATMTEYGYDGAGRLKCTAQRMNPDVWAYALPDKCVPGTPHPVFGPDRITRNVYTVHGDLEKIERAVGTGLQQVYASYTYSPNGRQTSVTDANGNKAEMTWDGLDRQKRWIFPSKTTPGQADAGDYEEYEYDANGNRTKLRKRDGSELTWQYDALNRVTVKVVPSRSDLTAAQTRDVYYDYDLRGLQTKARFDHIGGEGITNVYDGFGQLVSSSSDMGGVARTVGNLYDADGARMRVTHPDNSFFTYDLDGLGRMTIVRENGGAPIGSATYDSVGRRIRSGWAAATDYAFDPAGRLQSISHDLAGTSRDHVLGFSYNPALQIVTRSASNDAYAWGGAYNVGRSYAVNGLNQYTGTVSNGVPSAGFTYDLNGNLRNDGSTAFLYDVENRLVDASGAKTAGLEYDPLGRLFRVSGAGLTPRILVYDGDALIAEYDPAGTMRHRYIHGNDAKADDPIVWYDNLASGWRRGLVADHQGSIIGVADMYGNPVATNSYDPWGIPGAANAGRFGYTGQAWVPELGLWYYKARVYSPTLGRFLQVDPIGYNDQMNLYTYVGNDPVNRMDTTGLYTCKGKQCDEVNAYVRSIRASMKGLRPSSAEYQRLSKISNKLGSEGHRNGITIRATELKGTKLGDANGRGLIRIDVGKIEHRVATSIGNLNSSRSFLDTARGYGATVLGHEVDHEIIANGRGDPSSRAETLQGETQAFKTSVSIAKGLGLTTDLWSPQLTEAQIDGNVASAAEKSTQSWCDDGGPC